MSRSKHTYVAFHMDRWAGGTKHMTRLIKSVYFDICYHCWDYVRPATEAEQMLMLADLEGQGEKIINLLVASGKLIRDADGAVSNKSAIEEGQIALDLYLKKSAGGKKGQESRQHSRQDTTGEEIRVEKKEESDDPSSSVIGIDENFIGLDVPPAKTYDVDKIIAAWNEMAEPLGLALVRKASDERRRKTRERLDEYDEAEILEAISLISERPFCLGENDKGWKADFDWLIHPEKNAITGILEGGSKYGAEVHRKRQARRPAPQAAVRVAPVPEPEEPWTQAGIDEANGNFRKMGIETRFKLGDEGECITTTVKEYPDPVPSDSGIDTG